MVNFLAFPELKKFLGNICSLKQPIEVGSISTYLDSVYTGPDKFLNG